MATIWPTLETREGGVMENQWMEKIEALEELAMDRQIIIDSLRKALESANDRITTLFADHEAALKEKEQEFKSLLGHHEAQTVDFEEQIAALKADKKELEILCEVEHDQGEAFFVQIEALMAELEEGRRAWAESDEHKNAEELRGVVERQAEHIKRLNDMLNIVAKKIHEISTKAIQVNIAQDALKEEVEK